MRRLLCALVLTGLAAAPTPSLARKAVWASFSNKMLGISLRYPASWKRVSNSMPTGGTISLTSAGRDNYGLSIYVLPLRPGRTVRATLASFIAYERTLHITTYARLHWTPATVGGHPALATVVRPSTEGGVTLSDGIYLTQSSRHVYEIEFVAYHKPPFARMSQFPVIYSQILSTVRFF